MYGIKRVVFVPNFRTGNFNELHTLRSTKSENYIFSGWFNYNVYYHHNSKTNYSRKNKLGILYLYHMWNVLYATFYDDWTNSVCTRVHKAILIYCSLMTEFLVGVF